MDEKANVGCEDFLRNLARGQELRRRFPQKWRASRASREGRQNIKILENKVIFSNSYDKLFDICTQRIYNCSAFIGSRTLLMIFLRKMVYYLYNPLEAQLLTTIAYSRKCNGNNIWHSHMCDSWHKSIYPGIT